ncbi:hypothetical protein BUALT_Bualt03G0080100 [Buddleja alternifolia]|uniref:Bifunctional inhibitor/plant lipid transfer protein/seed storage helical domain-containing protein n=1 Tax=Buddleja alternifolia TaxID=168488 RepID=A0AAV6XTI1_9LAMI|nr:hypothetical protein BUALT_Bualt03G0080100 [Buddleja alternifolia]
MGCRTLLIMALATSRVSAISCTEAVTKLMPCQPFLLGTASSVTVPCCQGAVSLSQLIGSKPGELKSTCECLKQAAASMGVNVDRAKQLPQLCNITVTVPIDPNVDCNRWFVAVVIMAVVVGGATAAIQCNDAVTQVLPCEAFLMSGDSAPSAACCSAAQSLDKIATASQGDRRAICECFKETARI